MESAFYNKRERLDRIDRSERLDPIIPGCVALLVLIGIASVYSATYDAGASQYFNRQVIWAGAGFLLMIAIWLLPFRTLQMISYPAYAVSIVMLIAVLVAGKTVAGTKSWFGFGGFGLQPSEFVKITTLMALASYLSYRQLDRDRLGEIAATFGIVLLPFGLIVLQPDMGTAVIFLGALFLILTWAGAPVFLLLAVVAPAAAAVATLFNTTAFVIVITATLALLFIMRTNRLLSSMVFSLTVLVGVSVQYLFNQLAPYQQKRILTFLNPDADPLGAGYNVIQSKIAIGSGGIFGKGFLHGTQTQLNFLPAQWTDFIYCVPSEEFGFAGALLVLALLTALLLRGVQLASMVKSRFSSLLAIGIVSVLTIHVIINIGMVMGIMPVIGVPLPFLSYGGSSLLTSMIMAGILLNLHRNRKEY
ncbi:MAG TPA: rod shape-determining protein RodA [Bacteroidota bacterium]|nr:rod shape-determining protein RodA [Bacteroidota bacterium]